VHAQGGAVRLDVAERARLAEEEADEAPAAHSLCLRALHEAVLDGYELEHAVHELAAQDVNVRVRGACGGRDRCRSGSGTHADRETMRAPRCPPHLCSGGGSVLYSLARVPVSLSV